MIQGLEEALDFADDIILLYIILLIIPYILRFVLNWISTFFAFIFRAGYKSPYVRGNRAKNFRYSLALITLHTAPLHIQDCSHIHYLFDKSPYWVYNTLHIEPIKWCILMAKYSEHPIKKGGGYMPHMWIII